MKFDQRLYVARGVPILEEDFSATESKEEENLLRIENSPLLYALESRWSKVRRNASKIDLKILRELKSNAEMNF